ncbi:hypothetical protein [Saccharothrix texasensis]|uniref:Uncharacterized protein n=1 Tax=Saccharothrix texasensis TaxID=103734 RepID=A0A3N1HFR7_9PSEU|nr:hypothetical protein [Saccharothrix texasensis]ROP41320.1 hypothetical protein EDD40_6749 [Saccharothrix texasensis]
MDIALLAGLVLAAAAVVAATAVIAPTRRAGRVAQVEHRIAEFKSRFHQVKQRQTELSTATLARDPARRPHDVPLLTKAEWIFPTPIPLSEVGVGFEPGHPRSGPSPTALIEGIDLSGAVTYSDAIVRIAGMDHFTNGLIYRPVGVDVEEGSLFLRFREARYFDYLDTSEVLAYKDVEAGGVSRYRNELADPFDLLNRVASLGVLTLTVVKDDRGVRFLMHKRSARVVLAADFFHVVPAGEFTPSDVSLTAVRDDLDLWRNICREYAEELLGVADAQGDGGHRIDYADAEPYRSLHRARESGRLSVHVLGLGLDPLSLKPELLTVAVFDGETFRGIFGDRMVGNYEGTVVQDEPFDAETVQGYVDLPNVRGGAKACLRLSWRNREFLGLT